jgi:hypothetical protein
LRASPGSGGFWGNMGFNRSEVAMERERTQS